MPNDVRDSRFKKDRVGQNHFTIDKRIEIKIDFEMAATVGEYILSHIQPTDDKRLQAFAFQLRDLVDNSQES